MPDKTTESEDNNIFSDDVLIKFIDGKEGLTDEDLIEREAEILGCSLRPLFQRDNFDHLEKDGVVKMNSFDRPSLIIWPRVYANLRYDGLTQNQAIVWLQSKGLKWFLDQCEDHLYDDVANTISDAADKEFIVDPVEITHWSDTTTEIEKPDLFISRTEEDGVKVYSNHPELIGEIQIFEPPDNKTKPTEVTLYTSAAGHLRGDADAWQQSLETGKIDLTKFLKNFILKNT